MNLQWKIIVNHLDMETTFNHIIIRYIVKSIILMIMSLNTEDNYYHHFPNWIKIFLSVSYQIGCSAWMLMLMLVVRKTPHENVWWNMCTMFGEIETMESHGAFLHLIEYHQCMIFGFVPKFMKPLKESQNGDTMVIFNWSTIICISPKLMMNYSTISFQLEQLAITIDQ